MDNEIRKMILLQIARSVKSWGSWAPKGVALHLKDRMGKPYQEWLKLVETCEASRGFPFKTDGSRASKIHNSAVSESLLSTLNGSVV